MTDSNDSTSEVKDTTESHHSDVQDAPTKEVLLYAFGNVENGIANQFFHIIQTVMVVAMFVNPVLIGLVIGIKTVWDAITDPIFAHISDNTRSRWGRRIPYILVGGVSRIALLVLIAFFIPRTDDMASNLVLEGNSKAKESQTQTEEAMHWLKAALLQSSSDLQQLPNADRALITSLQALRTAGDAPTGDELEALTSKLESFKQLYTNTNEVALRYHPVLSEELLSRQARLETAQQQQDDLPADADETQRNVVRDMIKDRKSPVKTTTDQLRQFEESVFRVAITEQLVNPWLADVAKTSGPSAETAKVLLAPLLEPDIPAEAISSRKALKASSQDLRVIFARISKYADVKSIPPEEEAAFAEALHTGVQAAASLRTFVQPISQLTEELNQNLTVASAAALPESSLAQLQSTGQRLALEAQHDVAQAFLNDIEGIDKRLAAHDATATLLAQCQHGEKDIVTARNEVDAILAPYTSAAKIKAPKKGSWAQIIEGWQAFNNPANADKHNVVLFMLLAYLIFTTLTTIQSTSYYALGIELCPSYEGRTKVVMYRSYMDKIAGIAAPYIPVLCFLTVFDHALQGLFWIAILACAIGIPSTVLMCMFVKERTQIKIAKVPANGGVPKSALGAGLASFVGMFRSFVTVSSNRNFLRILAFYLFMGFANGLFQMVGGYLNIYYVVGSALEGVKWAAYIGTIAWGLTFVMLPFIKWGCDKYQKHNVLRFGLIMMAIGSLLKWWLVVPGHPEYQLPIPIFYSVGIATFYTVLSTMMADVTDEDELKHGERREGMFGAAMAFLMKIISSVTPVLAGLILVASGFDPVLEYHQSANTFWWMRLFYSIVPGVLVLGGLVLTIKYPLTRERVNEIKRIVRDRRIAESVDPGAS